MQGSLAYTLLFQTKWLILFMGCILASCFERESILRSRRAPSSASSWVHTSLPWCNARQLPTRPPPSSPRFHTGISLSSSIACNTIQATRLVCPHPYTSGTALCRTTTLVANIVAQRLRFVYRDARSRPRSEYAYYSRMDAPRSSGYDASSSSSFGRLEQRTRPNHGYRCGTPSTTRGIRMGCVVESRFTHQYQNVNGVVPESQVVVWRDLGGV